MKLSAGLINHYNQLYKQCEVPKGSIEVEITEVEYS